ncbi:UvrD-helicase domain-containing protein [Actinokineospora auranticolor]|uniref:DNA 3'-5' helicase n=1 Tax=Actinokineospora auranticolor TaxID=155976 RepID=A0A2S6GDY5_9PSEU|nr:UvrD-helicase domain-containing protein [Actinokineospora auranticolor]PPK63439.1 DNA helicase-2/ATP-dependent DNA helicase PcrA [Actinokineospora auranticolor]
MSLPLPGLALVSPRELAEELGLPAPTREQAEVIAAPPEPALVVAGAGAGKTETMAGRVVWLVANGLVTPDRVLGLTFTRKAARQLADRVRARLRRLAGSRLLDRLDPTGERKAAVFAGEPTILTYHAYAGRLVAEHGLRLPVEPGARLLTETASWQTAHRVVATWGQDLDTDYVPATVTQYVLALAGELAEHLVDPEDLTRHALAVAAAIEDAPRAKGQRADLSQDLRKVVVTQRFRLALLPLVAAYADRKRRDGALDFGDQMSLAARLAAGHPEVVRGERDRFGAVLLDEYQDTGHSQRVLLRSLFGSSLEYPDADPMPVTAVGDPAQAIYGWRGASAANLPRFTTDFPQKHRGRKAPAARYGLLTSFRNPPEVLDLANAVSAPLRSKGLEVDELRAREGAPAGDIRIALLSDVDTEVRWIADQVAKRWYAGVEEHGKPPTTAVLVRRRADMTDLAVALRERGLPVEVVGLGGLLDEPEVRDLVSALRVLIDPLAGTAAARLLTGSRWRVGAADLAALWRRAGALAGAYATEPGALVPGEGAEQAGLVDAIDDPGPRETYSEPGYQRVRALGHELTMLRRRLDQPLPELVADVERTMLLDIEATARRGGAGRAHLDAFADVVADYAQASPSASLAALLDYLATAESAEDGLEPGEVEVAEDRVQIVTVHSAKGLEWEVVAVPHLVQDVFPSGRRGGSWLRTVTELPADLRGDAADLPRLNLAGAANRKEVEEALKIHNEEFADRGLLEERRLFYVALTRSERSLLVSGHWWARTGGKPRGPSDFLTELADYPDLVDTWVEEPEEDAENPLAAVVKSAQFPADPLRGRRSDVATGAAMVRAELAALRAGHEFDDDPDDADGWVRDTDVLLAERAAAGHREEITLPDHLTVSQLVELAADPERLARKLRRPLPYPPNPVARRGTAFHAWLERRFGSRALLDLDELPGAADDEAAPDTDLEVLRVAFLRSDWAGRTPHEVEVPFSTEIDGVGVRGRMDAVFLDPDGGWTVVDWKTGRVPEADVLPALSVQLAAYRLAWASLSGVPLDQVRAAFHYVRHNTTLRPVDLLDADGLRALLRSVPHAT